MTPNDDARRTGVAAVPAIKTLFQADVTRDIAPVVYFHEQSPERLQAEVSEYVITGGYPEADARFRRSGKGIHESLVEQLTNMARELDKPQGPELPACWISGFYGSGKSSYAKLLGLALGGAVLPSGKKLSDAFIARDDAPKAPELRQAWDKLARKVDPLAVVFDIGAVARSDDHIHTAAVRQVAKALGYCAINPLVAEFELKLEQDGLWEDFLATAERVLGKPWPVANRERLADEHFSEVLHALQPQRYIEPMSWVDTHGGQRQRDISVQEAVESIESMLALRAEGKTLFIVIDEVSQYIHENEQRMLKLQSFVSELGQRLHGAVWLLVTGQQKLDDESQTSVLGKLKDRFPARLRVHLAPSNIRDVVHRRLLRKKQEAEPQLRQLFQDHRADLILNGWDCESVNADDFVEVYPMLPGHVDLLLRITSALRSRSSRIQGDDQAIRGLLQLLGEIFRQRGLAERPVGTLVTLEDVFEVIHSALDPDTQSTLIRVFDECTKKHDEFAATCARAVALLELIQDQVPTTAHVVAQCLYPHLGAGNQERKVLEALERLRDANLLGNTEKQGYKIQSSAGQEWERERTGFHFTQEAVAEVVRAALKDLFTESDKPKLQSRRLPWQVSYQDDGGAEVKLLDARGEAAAYVAIRDVRPEDRRHDLWIQRSSEEVLKDHLVWVIGEPGQLKEQARELLRSKAIVDRYGPRQEGLAAGRLRLLYEEKARCDDLRKRVAEGVASAWMHGKLYFRGQVIEPKDHGQKFDDAIEHLANRKLPDIYPSFTGIAVTETELKPLLEKDLSGLSTKLTAHGLGIVEFEGGRYSVTCSGAVPTRIREYIEQSNGTTGLTLLQMFARPPYGYTVDVVRACLAGLLRAQRIRIKAEGSLAEMTSVRDPDVKDFFSKERGFRSAEIFPAKTDEFTPKDRNAVCKLFEDALSVNLDRDNDAVADAVFVHFPLQRERLRKVEARLARLPGRPALPEPLAKLAEALADCVRDRHMSPTLRTVKRKLDTLRDGLSALGRYEGDMTDDAVRKVAELGEVRSHHLAQLHDIGRDGDLEAEAARVEDQLKTERPWLDIAALEDDIAAIRTAYRSVRKELLSGQEAACQHARTHIKGRPGFDKLTGDQQHRVLRPITEAAYDTAEDAIAPSLEQLRDVFPGRLDRATGKANELLDEFLATGDGAPVTPVSINLAHVEVASEAQLDGLLAQLRARVMERLARGEHVRLV